MTARREPAAAALLPALQRWAVETARDLYLTQKGAPAATKHPRATPGERMSVIASEALPLNVVEGLSQASRMFRADEAPPIESSPFSTLRERLLTATAGYDVVGFDVFNTLVVRSVEGEWLKTAVARAFHTRLKALVHPKAMPTVA